MQWTVLGARSRASSTLTQAALVAVISCGVGLAISACDVPDGDSALGEPADTAVSNDKDGALFPVVIHGFVIKTPSQRLLDMGIDVQDCSLCDRHHPAGTRPPYFLNYSEIADAFSHVPHVALWNSFGIQGFTASALSWDRFFYNLQGRNFPVRVQYSGVNSVGGLGVLGESDSRSFISLQDYAPASTVMHEIGHVLYLSGIKQAGSPFYDPGRGSSNLPPGIGSSNNSPSFSEIFGIATFSESRRDTRTEAPVGFLTQYSTKSETENLAVHVEWFVYHGDEFRSLADRQWSLFNSRLLWDKHNYIQRRIFHGLWFDGAKGTPHFQGIGL